MMAQARLSTIGIILVFLLLLSPVAYGALKQNTVRMLYFYSATCDECQDLKESFLPAIQRKYGPRVEMALLEISQLENYRTLLAIEKQSGRVLDKTPPLVIVGKDVLAGGQEIAENLEAVIRKYQAVGGCDWPEGMAGGRSLPEPTEQLQQIGLFTVLGAGLMDGVNPCAFTTLIFLLSYLAYVGRRGKELLLAGSLFTFGVFVAYFLIGLGLLEFVTRLGRFRWVSLLLKWATAGLTAWLAGLSFYDFIQVKKGRVDAIKLGLSDGVKRKIHGVIREHLRRGTMFGSAFIVGFLVAALEFPCTGQVYFPIILVLRQAGGVKARALCYLILYNLMFILPLLVVFILACRGVSSERFAKFTKENLALVKLFMGVLFLGLAALVLVLC